MGQIDPDRSVFLPYKNNRGKIFIEDRHFILWAYYTADAMIYPSEIFKVPKGGI